MNTHVRSADDLEVSTLVDSAFERIPPVGISLRPAVDEKVPRRNPSPDDWSAMSESDVRILPLGEVAQTSVQVLEPLGGLDRVHALASSIGG